MSLGAFSEVRSLFRIEGVFLDICHRAPVNWDRWATPVAWIQVFYSCFSGNLRWISFRMDCILFAGENAMERVTIQITKKEYRHLQSLAAKYGLSVSELARLSLEDLLTTPDEETTQAMEYILQKNHQLYQRLAK